MKNQETNKLFKRKTSSLKCLFADNKIEVQTGFMENTSKFLSPKNVKGLDTTMYKQGESLIRGLQEQVNKLKHQVTRLHHENTSLKEQNTQLRQEIEQHNEQQKNSRNEHFAAVDALNELKDKIDLLEDDQLSTFDEIEMQDVCHCHQYEIEVKSLKEKLRFLQESLLHSQEIIMKLQEQIRKIKFSKLSKIDDIPQKKKDEKYSIKLGKIQMKKKRKTSYKISSIEEILQVNEQ